MNFNSYKPLRLIELFAGIGSQAKALKNLGVKFEHWYVCEWDKYAIQSYNAVHGTDFDTSDITKLTAKDLNIVDTEHYNYLLTYSFPCQDLSNAGKGAGMEKGSGTRSGLLWEVERLLNECTELPQVLLMENVPQVHGKKNVEHFEKWIEFLESKGYSNYWKDLNAKEYGIPQNRNRCYMVSVLGDYKYEFPNSIPLELNLGDLLEKEVDEKFYLSEKALKGCAKTTYECRKIENRIPKNGVMPTLCARDYKEPKCVIEKSELKSKLCKELLDNGLVEEGDVIRHSYTNNRLSNGVENMSRTESKEKLSPTLDTRCDCLGVVVKEPSELQKEVCKQAMEKGLMKPYDIIDYTYSNARLGEILEGKLKTKNSTDNQIANTLTCNVENMGVCVPDSSTQPLPRKDIKTAERYCEYCGKPLERKRINGRLEDFTVFTNRKYCNRECMRRAFVKVGNHEQSYSCAHGTARKINELWLKKDECEICGSTQNLDIHHIDGNYQNNELDNLVCLCRSCHMKEEHRKDNLRIRKLTPLETWRLMGFDDEDCIRASKVCSNSQLYKQAGNSIVVNVLMAIFKELFVPKKTRSQWLDELLGGV